MKFLLLPVTVIFITLSSFTSNTTTVEAVEEDVACYDCYQTCANSATLTVHLLGGDFDDEVLYYEICARDYCEQ